MNDAREERIYVVIPATVPGSKGIVKQPIGRQAAQAAHVVSKMRVYQITGLLTIHPGELTPVVWTPITTILLAARDQKEMQHIWTLLRKKKIRVEHFADTNPDYGSANLITAICTEPVGKKQVEGILDYLPLWPGEQK